MKTLNELLTEPTLFALFGDELPLTTLQHAYDHHAPHVGLPPRDLTRAMDEPTSDAARFIRNTLLHAEPLLERIPDDALTDATWEQTLWEATRITCHQFQLERQHPTHLALRLAETLAT